jgi:hypothetical protein
MVCLPLAAGETDRLAAAVAKFDSDRAGEREAASQAVRKLLRAELAPLLAALGSTDPEVSRRAREAIASLLPPEKGDRQEGQASGGPQQGVFILGGNAQQRLRVVFRQAGKGQALALVPAADGEDLAALKRFGLEGYSADDALLRTQLRLALGRGFAVTGVIPGTAAARLGLQRHDLVLSVRGRPVQRPGQVVKALGKKESWNDVATKIMRAGALVTLPPGDRR